MDAEQSQSMVTLPGGYRVPAVFTSDLHGRAGRTPVSALLTVEITDDGRPHLRELALAVPDGPPLPASDLDGISLTELLDSAVRDQVLRHNPVRWSAGEGPMRLGAFLGQAREHFAAGERAATVAARAARDRRSVTPDLLRRVLDLYDRKGIGAVMDELNYSERNARRLLARARTELS